MNDAEIGDRLLRLRQDRKMSQGEFAERLGFSAGAYKNYERGEREVPSSLLLAAHKEFDADPLWLLSGETARPSNDAKLLAAVGEAVELAIADSGVQISRTKKWEIISYVYLEAIREGALNQMLIATLISVGGKTDDE